MRSLAINVARLRALRAKSTHPPEGDRLTDLKYGGPNPGALKARIYVPKDTPPNAPLVVALHGCTQSAAGYDYGSGWSRLADDHGFALLFPQQQALNNPNLCFNWFLPEDTRRGKGEALSIRRMIDHMVINFRLDPRRIFITGLSAGGAMASAMLASYPEVFAGGAIIAGLPFAGASTLPEAFDLMQGQRSSSADLRSQVRAASQHSGPWPTISIWHGSADSIVKPSNADAIFDQWGEVHSLDKAPSGVEIIDGQRRRFWRNAEGKVVIEEFIIAGMGHGTPLRTGKHGLGNAGAFMLEVGISSTWHIARFWGIVAPNTSEQMLREQSTIDVEESECSPENFNQVAFFGDVKSTLPSRNLKTVIEDALRKAGLMG